jgi:hypothetical protein
MKILIVEDDPGLRGLLALGDEMLLRALSIQTPRSGARETREAGLTGPFVICDF